MGEIEWPQGVNQDAYGAEDGYIDNREEVKYKSGRRVYYLKNSVPSKAHSILLKFDDKKIVSGSLTEWGVFKHWFENTIKSGTLPFWFRDLSNKGVGKRLYYMTDFSGGKGQKTKEVSFVFEEA